MKMKRKVFSGKQEKMHWPIGFTVWSWLLMDRFHAPGWAWGAWGTLIAIIWIASGVLIFNQEQVEIDLEELRKK